MSWAEVMRSSGLATFSLFTLTPPEAMSLRSSPFEGKTAASSVRRSNDLHTTLQLVLRDFELRYPLEDREERSFVERLELLTRALPEEDTRGSHSGIIALTAVDEDGDLLRQTLL